ncbi:uncharacterized protein LOC142180803 [Nicotiana tabacum]|uniref:Uncharacterized protein LOC142180803 n=1 Tax=Nicotiana tabacum TaxID=4097 RepID=A0AC58UHK5_TOBAC
MKVITWNVRGVNKVYKQKELMEFIKVNKVNVIAIIEHRVKECKDRQVINKIVPNWEGISNISLNNKGRIWLLWDPKVAIVKEINMHSQYIQAEIKCATNAMTYHFIAVYGLHIVQDRKELWRKLREIENKQQEPWLVMGDFNAIFEVEDRIHETMVQDHEIRDFREFVEDAGMTELKAIGRSFTWTNSHVFSKINRAIVNGKWMSKMPPIQVHVLDPYFSDHSPLCIELGSQQKQHLDHLDL